jgi:hypothetical protein
MDNLHKDISVRLVFFVLTIVAANLRILTRNLSLFFDESQSNLPKANSLASPRVRDNVHYFAAICADRQLA